MSQWKELPDAEGWWFVGQKTDLTNRWRGEWVYVLMTSETGEAPLAPHIFILDELMELMPKKYPIPKFYGPVEIGDEV